MVERFGQVDLHQDRVSNPLMGTVFEELIRKFNEALDENPGEHFTPRDVVHLMVDLLLAGDHDRISTPRVVLKIDNVALGSSLSKDAHTGQTFEYLITNPPYGKHRKGDQEAVQVDHERGERGRFGAGLPRISAGQLAVQGPRRSPKRWTSTSTQRTSDSARR